MHKIPLYTAASKTWTRTLDRTLDTDPKKTGPWKTWTQEKLDRQNMEWILD